MVLQRWQTLFLLVAVILMACLNFLPIGHIGQTVILPTDFTILVILSVLTAVILFICIFMYNNLRVQMRVTLLTIVLMCVMGATGVFLMYRQAPDAAIEWTGATLLLVCAVVMTLAAYRGMRRDYRTLRNADRLW